MMIETIHVDLVIIGAGLAGVRATIAAQQTLKKIAILTKGRLFSRGSSFLNYNKRWGITHAETDRECDLLLTRINEISQGTNIPHLSEILVAESAAAFQELRSWGVKFLPGNTANHLRRIAPCFCSLPLASIIVNTTQAGAMLSKRLDFRRLVVYENTRAISLQLKNDSISGVIAHHNGSEVFFAAPTVLLATGGNAARLTPSLAEPGLTGDGYELAQNCGLSLTNMEYPQKVWEDVTQKDKRFIVTALWDEKHIFKTAAGNKIELPTQANSLTLSRQQHVPISNLQADRAFDSPLLTALAPNISSAVQVFDKATGRLLYKIFPHAQASNGGITIGPYGDTPIPGLFAAGEVTTGMHGGDRIGGMMITNCLVFGKRAGLAAASYHKAASPS